MRFLILTALAFLAALPASLLAEETLVLGDLQEEDCYYWNEQTNSESLHYWRRQPPYIGYHKGEHLLAGGDGTCVLGLPKSTDGRALVLVNGAKIPVYPASNNPDQSAVFLSRDKSLRVELVITGTDSTCVPDDDKCCGEYTYVTITASKGNRKTSVNAVTYAGG